MKKFHFDCKIKAEECIHNIQNIVNKYNADKVSSFEAKQTIKELVISNQLYSNYLWNCLYNPTDIRTNETLMHIETSLSVFESKNRKTMERTGLSYARYPKWEVASYKIEDMAVVALTDKCIYIIGVNGTMIFPYNKIVNIGHKGKYAYFDIKTTSPYPHRFEICSVDNKDVSKTKNITLFLSLMCNWKTNFSCKL